MTEQLGRVIPFADALGIAVDAISPTEVLGRMPWAPERCTTLDVLHGGALMAFADTLGAVCAVQNLPNGAMTTTIESKTNFFRPVTSGVVHGRTHPLHVGRRTIVVQTDLTREDGKLVTQTTQTQAVLTND